MHSRGISSDADVSPASPVELLPIPPIPPMSSTTPSRSPTLSPQSGGRVRVRVRVKLVQVHMPTRLPAHASVTPLRASYLRSSFLLPYPTRFWRIKSPSAHPSLLITYSPPRVTHLLYPPWCRKYMNSHPYCTHLRFQPC